MSFAVRPDDVQHRRRLLVRMYPAQQPNGADGATINPATIDPAALNSGKFARSSFLIQRFFYDFGGFSFRFLLPSSSNPSCLSIIRPSRIVSVSFLPYLVHWSAKPGYPEFHARILLSSIEHYLMLPPSPPTYGHWFAHVQDSP